MLCSGQPGAFDVPGAVDDSIQFPVFVFEEEEQEEEGEEEENRYTIIIILVPNAFDVY